jgi:hypothetical protein
MNNLSEESPVLQRVAKGKKRQYHSDQAIDQLMSVVIRLTQELSVTRDRLDVVERMLDKQSILSSQDVDEHALSEEELLQRYQVREKFIERVFRSVTNEGERLREAADKTDQPKS